MASAIIGTVHVADLPEVRGALAELVKQRDLARDVAVRLEQDNAALTAELEGAHATIAHQCEAMSWITGHDRQGLDHLGEAQAACVERDAAEAIVRAVRDALDDPAAIWEPGLINESAIRAALAGVS